MRIKNKSRCSYSLLIPLLMTLVACQSESVPNVTQDALIMPIATSAPVEMDKVFTVKPTATNVSLIETAVPSPIPTLPLREKEIIVSELYQTNGGCELPCWWGIVPGETEWQTAKDFLSTLATNISTGTQFESDPFFSVEVDIPVPENLSEYGFLRHTFFVRDGIILRIYPEGPWGTSKIGTVSEILNSYGSPTEVLLDTLGYVFVAGDNYPFHVVLFYPEKGMLIRYYDEAELTDGYLIGCIQEDSGTPILWSSKLELTFIEALGRRHSAQYYKLLEEVTEMDVETFYQTYLDSDTEICIETPTELWLDR